MVTEKLLRIINQFKHFIMAKTKGLLGLIVGFAAGTFLGALFVAAGSSNKDKKKKKKEEEKIITVK